MLTKEECLEALNNFWKAQDENHRLYWSRSVLNKLIEEHFDNPPLKLEQLELGMWVWDSKKDAWICIDRPIVNVSYCKRLEDYGLVILFEENRYYRKEVK